MDVATPRRLCAVSVNFIPEAVTALIALFSTTMIALDWKTIPLSVVPTPLKSRLRRRDRGRPWPPPVRVKPLLRADLPDHAGAGELDEGTVTGRFELRGGVGLADIPHRAVIDDVGAAIRAEPDVCRAVEPATPADERLLELGVVGKPLDLQG